MEFRRVLFRSPRAPSRVSVSQRGRASRAVSALMFIALLPIMRGLHASAPAPAGASALEGSRRTSQRANDLSVSHACSRGMQMATRDLPALDLLKGFEAAARHLSFTKAGEELFLTQSAISRQVQALEEQLGTKLFHRRARALLLTDAGQRYLQAVRGALDGLRAATAAVRSAGRSASVTVSTTVTFASLWFVPKLAGFQSAQPA